MSAKQLITDHLDIWTAAHKTRNTVGRGSGNKIDLYGIKKLRELILGLGLQGLLHGKNHDLDSIIENKILRARDKYFSGLKKKYKDWSFLDPLIDEFDIPSGWKWKRVGELCDLQTGATPSTVKPQYYEGDIKWLVSGDINRGIIIDCDGRISEEGMRNSNCKILPSGAVMIALNGQGKTRASVALLKTEAACNQSLVGIIPFDKKILDPAFLFLALKYRYYEIRDITGQNQRRGLNMGLVAELSVPLAPIEDQLKIVAKVDELMAFCDQLEQTQSDNIAVHAQLVEALLATLTNSSDHNELYNNWQRIAAHFDTLFTTEHSIDQLKQTILQLAIMGKLVSQNPNDEPASELLKKIATEKARLIKEGKIKKEKPLPEITYEEKPFELPSGWEWVRLKEITSKITDGDHQTPPRIEIGFRLLSAKNVRDGFLDFENCDYIAEEAYLKSRERCLPESGDLLIVSVGGTIGRSSVVPSDSSFALVRSVALIKPLLIYSEFLKHSMDSSLLQDSIHSRKRGGAQPCLYLSEISMFPFVLPPLTEQHRIVAKVDELMILCDTLKNNLQNAQTTQLALADALVEQAVG